VANDPGTSELTPFGNPTDFAMDFLPDEVLQNAEISSEKVDGLQTTKYHFDKDSLQAVAQQMGEDTTDFADIEEMTLDVWLAEGNIPVKFAMNVSGTDANGSAVGMKMAFEISDINKDIQIERPIP